MSTGLTKSIGCLGVLFLLSLSVGVNWLLTYGICWVMMSFGHAIPFWPMFVAVWIVGFVIQQFKN